MAYERCVRKKLRSLFEYLDHDKDGRITPSCLQSGLIRLQNYSMESSTKNGAGACSSEYPQICEYEIEELLRAVPRYDNPLPCFPDLSSPLLLLPTHKRRHIYTIGFICIHSSFHHLFSKWIGLKHSFTSIMSNAMQFHPIPSYHMFSYLTCFLSPSHSIYSFSFYFILIFLVLTSMAVSHWKHS